MARYEKVGYKANWNMIKKDLINRGFYFKKTSKQHLNDGSWYGEYTCGTEEFGFHIYKVNGNWMSETIHHSIFD